MYMAAVCSPRSDNSTCRIVRGLTSILMDGGASEITPIANTVIDLVLNDVERLNHFTWSALSYSESLGHIGQSVVLLPESTTGENKKLTNDNGVEAFRDTILMVVAVALIAFFILSVCFYFALRKWHWLDNMIASRSRALRKVKESRYWRTSKGRRQNRWFQLDDHGGSGTNDTTEASAAIRAWIKASTTTVTLPNTLSLVTTTPSDSVFASSSRSLETQILQSATMAVSDLTSDSGSIKSSMKMDSIKEEEEAPGTDESMDDEERVMVELALAEQAVIMSMTPAENNPASYLPYSDYYSSSSSPDNDDGKRRRKNSYPDEPEGRMRIVDPTFSLDRYIPETKGVRWDNSVDMPPSYYDNSDPEADTPVRRNAMKIEAFDALGDPYLADESYNEGEEDDLFGAGNFPHSRPPQNLHVPTLASLYVTQKMARRMDGDEDGDDEGRCHKRFRKSSSIYGYEKDDDNNTNSDSSEDGSDDVELTTAPSDLSWLEGHFHTLCESPEWNKSFESESSADAHSPFDHKAAAADSSFDTGIQVVSATETKQKDPDTTQDSSDINDDFRRILRASQDRAQQRGTTTTKKSRLQLQVVLNDNALRNPAHNGNTARVISPESNDEEPLSAGECSMAGNSENNASMAGHDDVTVSQRKEKSTESKVDDMISDEQDIFNPDSIGDADIEDNGNGFVPVSSNVAKLNFFTPRARSDRTREHSDDEHETTSGSITEKDAGNALNDESACNPDLNAEESAPNLSGGDGSLSFSPDTDDAVGEAGAFAGVKVGRMSSRPTPKEKSVGVRGENAYDFFSPETEDEARQQDVDSIPYHAKKADTETVSEQTPNAELCDSSLFPSDAEGERNETRNESNQKIHSTGNMKKTDVKTSEVLITGDHVKSDRVAPSGVCLEGQVRSVNIQVANHGTLDQKHTRVPFRSLEPMESEFLGRNLLVEEGALEDSEIKQGKNIEEAGLADFSPRDAAKRASRDGSLGGLQDLRLLGPVVSDSTSEEVSLLPKETKTGDAAKVDLTFSEEDDDEEDENDDDSSCARLELPLPYVVSQNKEPTKKADSSMLSDITNASDIESLNNNTSVDETTISI